MSLLNIGFFLHTENVPTQSPEAREYQRQYYIAHREKIKARVKKWNEDNPGAHGRWLKAWKKANPDKYKAQKKKQWWTRERPDYLKSKENRTGHFSEKPVDRIWQLIKYAKGRAKKNGWEFDAEGLRASLVPPVTCPCCGLPINYAKCKQNLFLEKWQSPSLDRFDSMKPYTVENTVVICVRCNVVKGDATADEVEAVAAFMRAHSQRIQSPVK